MAERIDHAGEAEAWLRGVDIGDSLDADVLAVAKAQVHATLALVEQRRIANVIALASRKWELARGGDITFSILEQSVSDDGQIQMARLDPTIAAALGLDPS